MSGKDTNKLLDTIFPEAWYAQVLKAIDFAFNKLHERNLDPEVISKMIIDYNIKKRIQEVTEKNTNLILPKKLDWRKMDILEALEIFKVMLDACDLCDDLLSYTAELTLGKNNLLYNELLLWKECIYDKHPNLRVQLVSTAKDKVYLLKITKV